MLGSSIFGLMRFSACGTLRVTLLWLWVFSSGLGHVLSNHVVEAHGARSQQAAHRDVVLSDAHEIHEAPGHEHRIVSSVAITPRSSGVRVPLLPLLQRFFPVDASVGAPIALIVSVPEPRPQAGPASASFGLILRI